MNTLQAPDFMPENDNRLTGSDRARRFFAREWLYLLVVAWAILLLVVALLYPAAPEEDFELLNQEGEELNMMEVMSRLDQSPLTKSFLLFMAGGGLLLFLAGIPLLGYFLWQHVEGNSILGSEDHLLRPGWSNWDVLKSAALYFLIVQGCGGLLVWLFAETWGEETTALAGIFFANLLITGFILWLMTGPKRPLPHVLGLVKSRFFNHVKQGFVGYAAFFPMLVGLALLAFLLAHILGWEAEQNPLVPMVVQSDSLWFQAFILFFGALVGPITEEIFFRGFFYPSLRRRMGAVPAILVSAFCFAALHGNLIQLLPIFGLGVILALLRERSGSVIPSITLHCFHNLAVLCLLFALKPVMV